MPKLKKPDSTRTLTTEATAYLGALVRQFQEQGKKYNNLTAQLLSIEAQIELAEKTLCLTRDHLAMVIANSDSALPANWKNLLRGVRFVGVRLADACSTLLREHKRLTPEQILGGLNEGMFRFRTSSPLREIHAALLKQSFAEKTGQQYIWIGKAEHQMPLRMRESKSPMLSRASVSLADAVSETIEIRQK